MSIMYDVRRVTLAAFVTRLFMSLVRISRVYLVYRIGDSQRDSSTTSELVSVGLHEAIQASPEDNAIM